MIPAQTNLGSVGLAERKTMSFTFLPESKPVSVPFTLAIFVVKRSMYEHEYSWRSRIIAHHYYWRGLTGELSPSVEGLLAAIRKTMRPDRSVTRHN